MLVNILRNYYRMKMYSKENIDLFLRIGKITEVDYDFIISEEPTEELEILNSEEPEVMI